VLKRCTIPCTSYAKYAGCDRSKSRALCVTTHARSVDTPPGPTGALPRSVRHARSSPDVRYELGSPTHSTDAFRRSFCALSALAGRVGGKTKGALRGVGLAMRP